MNRRYKVSEFIIKDLEEDAEIPIKEIVANITNNLDLDSFCVEGEINVTKIEEETKTEQTTTT